MLAYADRRGRVEVAAVDTRRRLWRSAPLPGLVALAWSADGARLVAATRDAGRRVQPRRAGRVARDRGRAASIVALAASPPGARSRSSATRAGRSDVVLLDGRLRARTLFTGPGRLGSPAWSPDGRSLLVPWPEADQWLFLRARAGGRLAAVANVAAQFMPGASTPPFPGAVEWCCNAGG